MGKIPDFFPHEVENHKIQKPVSRRVLVYPLIIKGKKKRSSKLALMI